MEEKEYGVEGAQGVLEGGGEKQVQGRRHTVGGLQVGEEGKEGYGVVGSVIGAEGVGKAGKVGVLVEEGRVLRGVEGLEDQAVVCLGLGGR